MKNRVSDLRLLKKTPPWQWPEDAVRILLGFLRDRRAGQKERRTAVELSGEFIVMCEDLADALLAIVTSSEEPEDLRAGAAISLGPVLEQADFERFEDPEAVPISEATFHRIQDSLHKTYADGGAPKEVRRKALEASVRAREHWHKGAVRAAYASGDEDWRLTAVFCMGYVKGFERQILESLESGDPLIHNHAVVAAGNWEVDAAWDHIRHILLEERTDKDLLIAAVEASVTIRPVEACDIFEEIDSDDDDVLDAIHESTLMAKGILDEEDWEEEDWEEEDEEDWEEDEELQEGLEGRADEEDWAEEDWPEEEDWKEGEAPGKKQNEEES